MTDRRDDDPDRSVGQQRHVAAGGWRRAVIGLLIGALAGAVIAFVLPRDDLPRRRETPPGPPTGAR